MSYGPVVELGLQQNWVHVGRRGHTRRLRLDALRAPDLGALRRDIGVEQHVLRLERRNAVAVLLEDAAEGRRQQALAYRRAGALHHDGPGRHRGRQPASASSKTRVKSSKDTVLSMF